MALAGGGGRPERAVVDSRQVRPGDLFFGLRGERADGGEFAASALEAGAWGVVVEPERARSLAPAGADRRAGEGGRLGARGPRSARRAPGARSRLAARARLSGGGDHRVGGQDVGQGHLPRDPAPARPRQPGELQHRDRPAARRARRPAGDAGAGPRDGDARPGADRAALRDRGAQRRGDHQHRPRPPGAARRPGGDRRGEGRDPRRAWRARSRRRPRRCRGARAAPARPVGDDHLRRRRRRLRASVERRRALHRGHRRDARRRAALLVPVRGGAQPDQRPGGDRDRRGARGSAGRDGAAGAGDRLLAPARRAGRAGRRNASS